MKYTKELFHETVAILVNAYLNGTLTHGNCYACAVGNIVAARKQYSFVRTESIHGLEWAGIAYPGAFNKFAGGWGAVFCTSCNEQTINKDLLDIPIAKDQIESTKYHWEDLAKIEFAFETCSTYNDRMFNGLMAVVDVLCEIHGIDLKEKESAKLLFVKP